MFNVKKIAKSIIILAILCGTIGISTTYSTNNLTNFSDITVQAKQKRHHKRHDNYRLKRVLKSLRIERQHINRQHFNYGKLEHQIYSHYYYHNRPNKNVRRYQYYMAKVCAYNHMTQYTPLMTSIMQTESGGHGKDIMQCSGSAGLASNTLPRTDSIVQSVRDMKGITKIAHHLRVHHHKSIMSSANLSQAYNFGSPYLYYDAKYHSAKYRITKAKKYSKHLAELSPINKRHLRKYEYHHHYLYMDGGNYEYGKIVSSRLRVNKK